MTVWKKGDDFERAQKVEKTAATRKSTKSRGKNRRPGSTAIKEAQALLVDLGYSPGPPDGIAGPSTQRAIERYQASAGMAIDGEVTPALLDSLREAYAKTQRPPDAPSMRTEIGEDGVRSEVAEPEAVSEPPTIDLVIGAGISPKEADIIFMSTDKQGTPGKLNQYVISELRLGTMSLPDRGDLSSGYVFVTPERSDDGSVFTEWSESLSLGALPVLVFVVTFAGKSESRKLLTDNLTDALAQLRDTLNRSVDTRLKGAVGKGKLWLPLMGTGAGGLTELTSLEATLDALRASEFWRTLGQISQVLVSVDPNTTEQKIGQLVGRAQEHVEKTGMSFTVRTVTKHLNEPTVGEGKNNKDADFKTGERTGAIVTAIRPYFDNDQTAKDDALNVRVQAAIFAKLIAAREVALPLSIGLFGNWGSGKTYFMNLIRDEIAALAAGEDPSDEESSYMRRIAQIEFNAWHYVDTNLWASLAIRIFDGLAAQFRRREGDTTADLRARLRAEMESSTEAKTEAEKKQIEAQKEREKAANALEKLRAERREQNKVYDALRFGRLLASNAMQRDNLERIKGIAADFGLSREIHTVEDAARLAEQMRALNGQGRGVMQAVSQQFANWLSASVAVAVIVAFVVVFIGISAAFPDTSVYVGEVIAAISAAVAWAGNRLARISKGVDLLDSLRAGFAALKADEGETDEERRLREQIETFDARIHTAESQIAEADRRIAEAQAELQRINAGGLVYDFLEARGADPEYKKELGVISTIRQDFNGLKELLEDWNENYEAGSALPPIERIVLYIDDLDRCHPDKVVEVLQAVHLLLAFDLFVVIVAVDPRWLERSLYRAYVPELAERNLNGMGAQHLREFSPQNYLEKIFQIPFSLAAMSSDGYVKLINDLVVTRSEFQARREETAPAAPPTGEGEGVPGSPMAASKLRGITEQAPGTSDIEGQVPAETGAPAGPPDKVSVPKPSSDEEVLFNDWEQAFLQALHPFVPTPRLAKRMINIYRLIRVHALETEWRDTFFAPDGDYRTVLVLLALNIGHPRVGGPLLRLLKSEQRIKSFTHLLLCADPTEQSHSDQSGAKRELHQSITDRLNYDETTLTELVRVREKVARVYEGLDEWDRLYLHGVASRIPDDLETFALWAPEVGRFSFHWNLE
jgi:hypothetical protein